MFTVGQDYKPFCGAPAVSATVTDQTTTRPWAVATETAPDLAQLLAYFTIRESETTDLVLKHALFWSRVFVKRFGDVK